MSYRSLNPQHRWHSDWSIQSICVLYRYWSEFSLNKNRFLIHNKFRLNYYVIWRETFDIERTNTTVHHPAEDVVQYSTVQYTKASEMPPKRPVANGTSAPLEGDPFNFAENDAQGSVKKPLSSARSRRFAKALGNNASASPGLVTPVKKLDMNVDDPPSAAGTPSRKRLADEFSNVNGESPTPKRRKGRQRKEATATVVKSGIYGGANATPAGTRGGRGRGRGRARGRGRGSSTRGGLTPSTRGGGTPGRPRVRFDDDSSKGKNDNANESKEDEIEVNTRSYFDAHRGNKHRTSTCTLADLHLPPAEKLLAALKAAPDLLSDERDAVVSKMCNARKMRRLLFQLHAGSSLLFYGPGSKRPVLHALTEALAENCDVLEVCGFNPALNVRGLLGKIIESILRVKAPFARRTLMDYVTAVATHIGKRTISVVVHNIDGPTLRSADVQRALATLSAIPGVLFAASVDQVNAPLLWDGATWATYAWAWVNVNTFAHYDVETVFATKSMLHGSRERRVEGAVMLLRSLSNNARKVFNELAEGQTAVEEGDAIPRTTFNKLFEVCRRGFICTDTSSLRSILTELETHDMLERRRGADAEEQIWIPLSVQQLKDVLEQITQ